MPTRRHAWEMNSDDFIGPAIASPAFAIDGRDGEYALVWEAAEEGGLKEIWRSPCGSYAACDLDWDDGPSLVLYGPGEGTPEPIGFYLRGQCWIDEAWRGRGLAVELILAAAELAGGSPTANPDGMGFSEAGLGAHRKAHRVAVERAIAAGLQVPEAVLSEYAPGHPRPRP